MAEREIDELVMLFQRKLEQFGYLARHSHLGDDGAEEGGENLTRTEGMALMALAHCAPGESFTPTQLARLMHVSLSAITHKLNALERTGYVQRAASREDRREVLVALSERGKVCVRDMQAHYTAKMRALIAFLGEEDTRQFLRLLERVFEFARAGQDAVHERAGPPPGG